MKEQSKTNSFCDSSNDSGRFTEIGELQDCSGDEADRYHQDKPKSVTFANRFVAYGNHQSRWKLAKGVFLRNLTPIPIDTLIDPIFSTCFNCWQFGHRYQECIFPKNHTFCVNCGRMHVLIDQCPRCSRAYHQYVKKTIPKRKETVNRFSCNYQDEAIENNNKQFETKQNHSEIHNTDFSKNSIAANDLSEDQYYCHSSDGDESENFNDIIIDEDEEPKQPRSEDL